MNKEELTLVRDVIRELICIMPNTPTLRHGATKPEAASPPSKQMEEWMDELRVRGIEALDIIERELPPQFVKRADGSWEHK
jgi:hypothetical protein